jgi:hypothetical protein
MYEGIFLAQDTKQEKDTTVFFGKGTIAVIAGIVIILLAFLVVSFMQAGQGTIVPAAVCGEKTVAYANANLVQEGTTLQLVSVMESKGLYELKAQYQSNTVTLYTTRDCTLLFTNTVNMSSPVTLQQDTQAAQAPVKTPRPVVDLYVMAFCPFGTQAETIMQPVVNLLNATADIRVRYITTIGGSTIDSVNSLHGPAEAAEDLRQTCISKYYPGKYWSYLSAFNEACYPSWQNATALASCRKDTMVSLGMENLKIDTCASGAEGLDLLHNDETEASRYGVSGSPTLVINGVTYSGARTPEAYKQAICTSFQTTPAECSTVLSSASVSASSGGCG